MNGFGRRLQERRKELGLTQDELAARIGKKDRSVIAKYEAGKIREGIPVSVAKALAVALNTTPNWLLGWETKKPRSAGTEPRQVLKGHLKHKDKISRTVETVKGLCAGKLSYDEMVEAVRTVYPRMDKPLLSKAMNTEKYGVTLTIRAVEIILDEVERKQNDKYS